jgi:hypothetical protein
MPARPVNAGPPAIVTDISNEMSRQLLDLDFWYHRQGTLKEFAFVGFDECHTGADSDDGEDEIDIIFLL